MRSKRGAKDRLAGEILSRLEVGERQLRSWTANPVGKTSGDSFELGAQYNAVHFNLDTDWLLFANNRSLYKHWRAATDPQLRQTLSASCRRDAHPSITRYARRAVRLMAAHTIATFWRDPASFRLPVVIATAIGQSPLVTITH